MSKRNGAAKERWLKLAEELLDERGDIDRLLTVQSVVDRSGMTRQAFNSLFGTHEKFIAELLEYVLRPERFLGADTIFEALGSLTSAPDLAAVRAFLHQDFQVVRDSPGNGMLMSLMSGKPNGKTARGLRNLYNSFDNRLAPLLDEVLAAWNREPTPPLTSRELAIIFDSLVDGLTIRARFDPDGPHEDLYITTVFCLLPMVTRVRTEAIEIEDRIALLAPE